MSDSGSTTKVLILLIFLLLLLVCLFYFYKKLNRVAEGKYTVRNMMLREGGIRDRVRGAASAVGSRLGVQLWPGAKSEEDGEEMQEMQDEEEQVEDGDGQGSDSEGGDEEGGDSENQGDGRRGKGEDTTDDDNTSSEGSHQEDQAKPVDQQEAKAGLEKEKDEVDGRDKGEASGGTGLLIDFKQFSGSAIWSEEGGSDNKDGDITAL